MPAEVGTPFDFVFAPMREISVVHLSRCPEHIPVLAQWLFAHWGTGLNVEDTAGQESFLARCASGDGLPTGFAAVDGNRPLGFACLMNGDLPTRPELNPWLAQVYVTPAERKRGAATRLVRAVVAEAQRLGHPALYLYTSAQLTPFYRNLGWELMEVDEFRGKQISIMRIGLTKPRIGPDAPC